MGMAAILVMWPGSFEQNFVPLSHEDTIWNLASIGPVVSEEKTFKECGRQKTARQRTTEANLSYKLNNGHIWRVIYIYIYIYIYICSVQSRNRYNSRIVLRKVGILTLLRKVGILTLRKTILELLLRNMGIGTKWEYLLLYTVEIGTK